MADSFIRSNSDVESNPRVSAVSGGWRLRALMTHGFDPAKILRYYMGFEDGNAVPEDVNAFSINGSVGSQLPHAVGLAWSNRLRGDDGAAYACYFGDGATSEGDVHEAMTFAGVFDTPNVFFCQNNGWAISVPRERQTAAETLARKAAGYGFEDVRVDGTDPLAVYLEAPIERVTGFDVPFPLYATEEYYLPERARIVDRLREVVAF